MPSPNLITPSDIRTEGISAEGEALSLDLTEEEILRIIGDRVDRGKAFWDKKLDLTTTRENNKKRWMNRNFEVSGQPELYDYQVDYRDNRIFLSIETLVSQIVSKTPQPVVTEAQDTDASRELAYSYGMVLRKKAEIELYIKGVLQMAARHLLMGYRCGILKYGWDFGAGRMRPDGSRIGEVFVKAVRSHNIVFDEEADNPYDIPLIAEYLKGTVGELIYKFPDKRAEILAAAGIQEGEKLPLGKKVDYLEIWFSYLDKQGNKQEAVCWKLRDILLDSGKNPNFNYDDDPSRSNFFDAPMKPYVVMRMLSDGEWVMDDTSLTEQASSLQDNLEKRGRQISENADKANSTEIFNVMMIPAKTIERYTGDPSQKIKVKGDVRSAFKREPPPLLPSYVQTDKLDSRAEIDNIFGTHAPLRGEKTEAPTLGQEILSQRSDLGRTNPLVAVVEKSAADLYRGITQIYKVFAEEEHIVKYAGENGQTVFAAFSRDKIEDGIEINIQAGSMQPDDKTTDKTEAIELAKIGGRIDPLSFFEKWHVPNPREWAKRLVYFLWMPDRYMAEVIGAGSQEGVNEATQTIQRISAGENVPPKENPSKDYLSAYGQFVQSPAFKQLPPEQQQLHLMHLRGTVDMAKQGMAGTAPAGGNSGQGLFDKIKGMFGG